MTHDSPKVALSLPDELSDIQDIGKVKIQSSVCCKHTVHCVIWWLKYLYVDTLVIEWGYNMLKARKTAKSRRPQVLVFQQDKNPAIKA